MTGRAAATYTRDPPCTSETAAAFLAPFSPGFRSSCRCGQGADQRVAHRLVVGQQNDSPAPIAALAYALRKETRRRTLSKADIVCALLDMNWPVIRLSATHDHRREDAHFAPPPSTPLKPRRRSRARSGM